MHDQRPTDLPYRLQQFIAWCDTLFVRAEVYRRGREEGETEEEAKDRMEAVAAHLFDCQHYLLRALPGLPAELESKGFDTTDLLLFSHYVPKVGPTFDANKDQAAEIWPRLKVSIQRLLIRLQPTPEEADQPVHVTGQPDTKPDKTEEKIKVPRNPKVCKLINEVNRHPEREYIDLAREIAEENEKAAQGLVRQMGRYKHLLNRQDK